MTCKDCIHQAVCLNWCRGFGQEAELCEHFSDKSKWVHLTNKDYKTAYYALGRGKSAVLIEEPIYGWGIKDGKYYVIDECETLYEIGKEVFLKKEAAEKEVERRKKQ